MLVLLFYEPQTPVYTETFNDPLVTLRLLLYSLGGVRFWPFSNKKLCNNFSGSTEVFFYFLHPHLRSLAYSFSPQLRLTLFLSQVWANSFPPQLILSLFLSSSAEDELLSSSVDVELIPFLISGVCVYSFPPRQSLSQFLSSSAEFKLTPFHLSWGWTYSFFPQLRLSLFLSSSAKVELISFLLSWVWAYSFPP